MPFLFITCLKPFTAQKCFTFQTANNNSLTMATTHVTHALSNLATIINDQGPRDTQIRPQLQWWAATHWCSLPMDPSLTWDHSGDTASNVMTVSHHYKDSNFIPLLPCYYQPDIAYFMDKVGNLIPDGAVTFINDSQFKYHESSNHFRYIQVSMYLHHMKHSHMILIYY